MRKVLIIDDETIIRIALRSMSCWEKQGFEIVKDAIHGKQALEYLEKNQVDLVVTDMKMPVMDGIALMKAMNMTKHMPKVVALSGYDDFKLVREAFRLGACDYLLKTDLNEELLSGFLRRIQQELMDEPEQTEMVKKPKVPDSALLANMAMGKEELQESFFSQDYLVIQFEVEDFQKHSVRFAGQIQEGLMRPMLEFANQIPRVAAHCVIGTISPSRYVMFYRMSNVPNDMENAVSVCKQLCNVWHTYMNLPIAAGISNSGSGSGEFLKRFEEAGELLRLQCLKGKAGVSFPWEKGILRYDEVCRAGQKYERLLQGVMTGEELVVQCEKQKLFQEFYTIGTEQSKRLCLSLICNLAWLLQSNHDNIHDLFPNEINYYEKIERLHEISGLELWLNNYFRWIVDYAIHQYDRTHTDLMIRAKYFIMDNYSNPELTLGSVAGYIGLNEKYFSSRFTKEEGTTFSNYLAEVRIRKARQLVEQTDMKIYEISQSVGYNSVEHFTRVYKKICGISPGACRKKI